MNYYGQARPLDIPQLDDAILAGTKDAQACTLIVTEGDSAKSLAMAGVQVVGRDKYGVFPINGKLINVHRVALRTVTANKQIQNIMKILGLHFDKAYLNVEELRYGSIMIMIDQDSCVSKG